MSTSSTPISAIGIIADVQYADVDDGWNFKKTAKRCFRKTADCLEEAIETFDEYSERKQLSKICSDYVDSTLYEPKLCRENNPKISTILELGDLTDGRCTKKGQKENIPDEAEKSIEKLLKIMTNSKYADQQLHCCGNHEFYNFSREQLRNYYYKESSTTANINFFKDTFAYITALKDNSRIKIIHLDSYDISQIGRPNLDNRQIKAENILKNRNPNVGDYNSATNLHGDDMRFVAYTGTTSKEQLNWFSETLERLDSDPETDLIILMSHCNIHPRALKDQQFRTNTIWDFKEILKIIDQKNKNLKILTHLCGHHHNGGYYLDQGKQEDYISEDIGDENSTNRHIHHITMGGIIEHTDDNVFGIMEFYEKFAVLRGFGYCGSRFLSYGEGVELKRPGRN